MSTYDEVLYKSSLNPAARTNGTANGTAVDRMANGGMQDAVAVVHTGVITEGTHVIALEDSDDGSTGWAAVPAAQLQGSMPTVTNADGSKVYEIGVRSTKRFLRVTATTTGATVGGVYSAAVALGRARFEPVSRA